MAAFQCLQPKKIDLARRKSKELDKRISKWFKEYRQVIKLLLLGAGESGKTTIIKQMKIIHIQGFTEAERREKATEIRLNVLEGLQELVNKMMKMSGGGEDVFLKGESSSESFRYLTALDPTRPDFEFDEDFYEHVQRIWSDLNSPQQAERVERATECSLGDSAKYFLERLDEIRSADYLPSDQDILQCRRRTTEIQKIEFEVKIPRKYGGGTQAFWMFDVGGQRGERRKWIQVFDGITAVLFLVATNEFDMTIREDGATNRLAESLRVFEEVWYSRFLRTAGVILFLNKQDLLQEKVERGVRLEDHFPEYVHFKESATPREVRSPSELTSEYYRARAFIREKFLSITRKVPDHRKFSVGEPGQCRINNGRSSLSAIHGMSVGGSHGQSRGSLAGGGGGGGDHNILVGSRTGSGRILNMTTDMATMGGSGSGAVRHECYAHYTVATDTNNIKTVFDDIHTMIVIWNLKTCLPT